MRPLISAAAVLLALALALFAACSPRDASAPATNAATAKTSATSGSASVPNAPPTAANGAATTQQTTAAAGDNVARVTEDELRAAMTKNAVALYDVRDKASYEAGHIKGAKNVPWEEVERRLAEFPKDRQIVTYCA